jgi:2-polyprenyl-3-methyl-5-hydroxy-6-metoxy-1,4-benzoquinol methylase
MKMGVEEFLELFIRELESNSDLRDYYRLINKKSRYFWRKAYLEQRLNYISRQTKTPSLHIWDVGCGYATTAIFLALNGHRVRGNTLEFYFDKINNRINYWSKYGNLSNLYVEYANLYDMTVPAGTYDAIIAQDTLHHLEPVNDAFEIFRKSLVPGGRLIVSEENGQSLFIRLKNFSTRGFNRINEYYDQQLQKTILFGNENARSLNAWLTLLNKHGFSVVEDETEYIRSYPPFMYTSENYRDLLSRDKKSGHEVKSVQKLMYFGINLTANSLKNQNK